MKSLSSVFKLYLFILEAYVDVVEELYHSHFVNDIKSYQSIILRRIVNSLKTLDRMLVVSNDPISAYGLLRTIADSICVYCFIYENDNNQEIEFRHYLYLLDGCSQFVNDFPQVLINNELIDKTEEDKHNNEYNQEETNLIDFQRNLLDYIHNTIIAQTFRRESSIIINRCDWKYRKVSNYTKTESFNWRDLYEKAGCDAIMVNFLSSFLSQYVHGLFLSNTKNPNSAVHYSIILDCTISLEKMLKLAIESCFKEDNIQKLMLNHINLDKFHDLDIDRSCIISFLLNK